MELSQFTSFQNDLDSIIIDQLGKLLNCFVQKMQHGESNEIQLPTSLSIAQMNHVLNNLSKQQQQLNQHKRNTNLKINVQWFYPISKITIRKEHTLPEPLTSSLSTQPSTSSSSFVANNSSFNQNHHHQHHNQSKLPSTSKTEQHCQLAFNITITLPAFLKDQLIKLSFIQTKKCSNFFRLNEQFHSNFNILTYFNTKPIIPNLIPQAGGLCAISKQQSQLQSVQQLPQQQQQLPQQQQQLPQQQQQQNDANSSLFGDGFNDMKNFLEEIYSANQIQVITGLSKEDKLNLIILLNNRCSIQKHSCRIVYLQSLSILTFWMAMKVKELCHDYYWNIIGYQITLESKTSPNNSIIFFEMATFIRALNRDLDMNLITHLIIDIDQNHLFFNLLLLYLKENFDKLRHIYIFILTTNRSQAHRLQEYFAPEVVYYTNYNSNGNNINSCNVSTNTDTSGIFNNQATSNSNNNSSLCNVKQLFLEDILPNIDRNKLLNSTNHSFDSQMEQIMAACWQQKVPVTVLVEFIGQYSSIVNYHSHELFGVTPLILSVVHGTLTNIYQLLSFGANCHQTSWNGMEPIEWAIQYRREDVFQMLFVHYYATNDSFDLNFRQYYSKKFFIASSMQPTEVLANCCMSNIVNIKTPPLYHINYELILRLLPEMIKQIYYSRTDTDSSLGSILILLPSYNNVSTLRKIIINEFSNFDFEFTIFCLYPHVPNNELDVGIGILASATNQVRVILSTFNVDSIFLDDIVYVINTGVRLEKVQSAFSTVNLYRLISNQAINSSQFQHGYYNLFSSKSMVYFYNLYSSKDANNLISDECADVYNGSIVNYLCTDSMYHCIFAAKCFQFKNDKIMDIFQQMISMPNKIIISNALQYLKNINVFDDNEHLTELGKILIDLSIEPHYAKMIIYSVILKCLDPILTIVCALSSPNSFQLSTNDADKRMQDFINLSTLSHNSFSDHLTYVYAFQKWQELSRSNSKNNVKFDRNDIILFSSFEMIYSLRTKILGQLRAIGFVKGKGSMNIRQLNVNSDNFALVKAAICAGQPLDHFVQVTVNQNSFTFSKQDQQIYAHPNSILNFHLKNKNIHLPSNLVLYDRKITCGQMSYIQNCTLINPLTVAIFADEIQPGSVNLRDNSLVFENEFQFGGDEIQKVFQVRQRWQQFIKKRILNMQLPITEEENAIIREVIRLITSSDDYLGFGAHTNIGRAPQVMSTYFCSTVMIKKQTQQQKQQQQQQQL